ncbi:hypothetical protein [Butyrivibrio sp. AE3004]|uniref:hypothetical protein n=1 Tax=Butyrivibrio sp. AE3004 TaxID=1506994 RepID=UPI000494A89D|nr:hypothetical protein [Butyrivibrio sp. AE3004]
MKNKISMLLVGTMIVLAGCGNASTAETTEAVEQVTEAVEDAAEEVQDATETITDEATATTDDATTTDEATETSGITDVVAEPEHTPMDISDCATFTDIVNKLQKDQGYANTTISGTDVLIVTDYTYECGDNGEVGTIEGYIYRYNEDKIEYLGYVTSGGTANPLMIDDGKLYTAGHHFLRSYVIDDDGLKTDEEIYVNYDTEGNATVYKVEDGKDVATDMTEDDFYNLFSYMENGEYVIFDTIK